MQNPTRRELRSECSSRNWIPGNNFDAGGRGGREASSASSPCCSPEHRSNSVSSAPRSPLQMLPSALVRYIFGDLWLYMYSMLFRKSQPCLSGTAGRERKGLSPCAPVTISMGGRKKKKKGSLKTVTSAYRLTNKCVCVCIHTDIPGCVCTDAQANLHPSLPPRCLWIYAYG